MINVGEKACAHLDAQEDKEAWAVIKPWYHDVRKVAPTPDHRSVKSQTKEREELDSYNVLDDTPDKSEIRRIAKECLHNGKSPGYSKMRAEDINKWIRGKQSEEEEDGKEGAGYYWDLLVELIQAVWDTGEIPQELNWIIIVLMPKDQQGGYRGIGLMEPI